MYALKVNSYIWKSNLNSKIDKILKLNGIKLIKLKWNKFDLLKNDKNHFTWNGYKKFCKDLSKNLKNKKISNLHIISDSTIDYHNYDKYNHFTGQANKYLIEQLQPMKITIDAICGSGFCARQEYNEDFLSRINKTTKNVLFIGGWNDSNYSVEDINKKIISVTN